MSSWIPVATNKKSWQEQLDDAYRRAEERKLAKSKPYCSYWYDGFRGDTFQRELPLNTETGEATYTTEYLMKLAGVRRAIANYANIILNRKIPVIFSTGEESYSLAHDGEEFLVISATADPEKFDANCGVTLHETSHIKWSQYKATEPNSIPLFKLLIRLAENPGQIIPDDLLEFAEKKFAMTAQDILRDLKFLLNVIEDRRIDQLMYEYAVGYRPYYDAMYEEHWHTPEISKALLHPRSRSATIENYRFHICNMTNSLADPTALPELDKIWALIDLKHINRFSTDPKWQSYSSQSVPDLRFSIKWPMDVLPDMLQAALKIIKIIYENSDATGTSLSDRPKKGGKSKWKKGMKLSPGDPNNHDTGQNSVSTDRDDYTDEEWKELMEEVERMVNGQYKKEHLNSSMANELNALTDANAEMKDIGDAYVGKAKCLIYRKLSRSLINSDDFLFSGRSTRFAEAVSEGISLGQLLATRITVLADESTLTFNHQPNGKLDKRRIHALGYSTKDVFEQTHLIKYAPIAIHLSIDSSGSMAGAKWFQAIKLASAMAAVSKKIRTIDLVISFRASDELVKVLIAFDSRTDDLTKVTSLFPHLGVGGGTPEGLSFQAIKEIINTSDFGIKKRKYFINISDGQPAYAGGQMTTQYSGEPAWAHTRRQINSFKDDGMTILSYYVEEGRWGSHDQLAFRTMYGPDAQFINISSLTDIARTLNQMMLRGEANLDK